MTLIPDKVRKLVLRGDGEGTLTLEVEKMGNPAFDYILELMGRGTLTSPQRIRALQTLSLLTRQFCPARKPELLQQVLKATRSTSKTERSIAARMAIPLMSLVAQGKSNKESSKLRTQVLAALKSTLDVGVDQTTEEAIAHALK